MTRKSWVVLIVGLLLVAPGLTGRAVAVDPGPPVSQTPPSIAGAARVGVTLAADPGTWAPDPVSYAYAWLRDGSAIADATGASYRVTGADYGHRLAVQVVATGADPSPSAPATSAQTATVGLGRFAVLTRPSISGVRRWGRTLTASPGTWSPAPTMVRYQWLRNGTPIRGATGSTRKTTVADFGTHLSVRVAARRSYYANGITYSPATRLIDHRIGVRKRFTYSISTRGRITADLATFARLTAASYADPRGWRAAGYEFRRVAHGGDFTLVLSAAGSVPSFGYPCSSTWSCRVGRYVIINQTRWLHASPAWNAAGLALRDYRHMVLNHETGHWLGHGHQQCPGPGRLAPVMMQQSKGLNGCRFNPFPLPSERWTHR